MKTQQKVKGNNLKDEIKSSNEKFLKKKKK